MISNKENTDIVAAEQAYEYMDQTNEEQLFTWEISQKTGRKLLNIFAYIVIAFSIFSTMCVMAFLCVKQNNMIGQGIAKLIEKKLSSHVEDPHFVAPCAEMENLDLLLHSQAFYSKNITFPKNTLKIPATNLWNVTPAEVIVYHPTLNVRTSGAITIASSLDSTVSDAKLCALPHFLQMLPKMPIVMSDTTCNILYENKTVSIPHINLRIDTDHMCNAIFTIANATFEAQCALPATVASPTITVNVGKVNAKHLANSLSALGMNAATHLLQMIDADVAGTVYVDLKQSQGVLEYQQTRFDLAIAAGKIITPLSAESAAEYVDGVKTVAAAIDAVKIERGHIKGHSDKNGLIIEELELEAKELWRQSDGLASEAKDSACKIKNLTLYSSAKSGNSYTLDGDIHLRNIPSAIITKFVNVEHIPHRNLFCSRDSIIAYLKAHATRNGDEINGDKSNGDKAIELRDGVFKIITPQQELARSSLHVTELSGTVDGDTALLQGNTGQYISPHSYQNYNARWTGTSQPQKQALNIEYQIAQKDLIAYYQSSRFVCNFGNVISMLLKDNDNFVAKTEYQRGAENVTHADNVTNADNVMNIAHTFEANTCKITQTEQYIKLTYQKDNNCLEICEDLHSHQYTVSVEGTFQSVLIEDLLHITPVTADITIRASGRYNKEYGYYTIQTDTASVLDLPHLPAYTKQSQLRFEYETSASNNTMRNICITPSDKDASFEIRGDITTSQENEILSINLYAVNNKYHIMCCPSINNAIKSGATKLSLICEEVHTKDILAMAETYQNIDIIVHAQLLHTKYPLKIQRFCGRIKSQNGKITHVDGYGCHEKQSSIVFKTLKPHIFLVSALDAEHLIKKMGISDSVIDGTLQATVNNLHKHIRGTFSLKNFFIRNNSILLKMIALSSPTIMTSSDSTIGFNMMQGEIALVDDKMVFNNVMMTGPVVAISASGYYEMSTRNSTLSGLCVPLLNAHHALFETAQYALTIQDSHHHLNVHLQKTISGTELKTLFPHVYIPALQQKKKKTDEATAKNNFGVKIITVNKNKNQSSVTLTKN